MHIEIYDQGRDGEREIPYDELEADEFYQALSEELSESELPDRKDFVQAFNESQLEEEGKQDQCTAPSAPHHTVSTQLLTSEPGLLGETYKLCTATPSNKYVASNARDDIQHIYVNGMNGDLVKFLSQLDWLTRRLGQPVTAVINGQRSSLNQYFAAWMGIIHPVLGHKFEYTGVSSLKDVIQKNAQQGVTSRIFAHSHGAIIARVALGALKKECSPSEWKEICKHVEVVGMGCFLYDWPKDVRVTQYNHDTDSISALTGKLSRIFHPLRDRNESDLHKSVSISAWTRSLAHNLYGYVTHFPDFFIAEHSDENGTLDSRGLADAMAHSIAEGHYADSVHRSLLKKMIQREDVVFFEHFLSYVQDDAIGAFELPFSEEIQDLIKKSADE